MNPSSSRALVSLLGRAETAAFTSFSPCFTAQTRFFAETSTSAKPSDAKPQSQNAANAAPPPRNDLKKTTLTTDLQDVVSTRIVEAGESTSSIPTGLSPRLVAALARSQKSEAAKLWEERIKSQPRWTSCPIPGIESPLASPWTPTRNLIKRKSYVKRGRFTVKCLEAEQVKEMKQTEPYRSFPSLSVGDQVEVLHINHEMGPQSRPMLWKGVVTHVHNVNTLRHSIGVESIVNGNKWLKTWMIYSKDIQSIKLVQKAQPKQPANDA